MDITQRPTSLSKGEWGRLLIITGSSQFAGASVLATLGAQRTGLDRVVVFAPERAANAVLFRSPDAITLGVTGRVLQAAHYRYIQHFTDYPVALGPGLTAEPGVGKLVKSVLKRFTGPFVIDADGLRIIAKEKSPQKLWQNKQVVLTPSRAEYALLAGEQTPHPLQSINKLARDLGATILAKGPTDVISDGKETVEIPGGSALAAKTGSGDVLTGVVGALVSRGVPGFEAAKTASRLLKTVSQRAEQEKGPGLLAVDLAERLDLRLLDKQQ